MLAQYKANTPIETVYTYAEWEKIYNRRMARKRAKRRAEATYYIKQKLSGFVMVAIGVLIPFICDGDATASLLVLPMGLYLLFTKEKVMDFKH